MANKQMKISLTSSVIKKKQNKTMIRYSSYLWGNLPSKQKHPHKKTSPPQNRQHLVRMGEKTHDFHSSLVKMQNAARLENSLVVSHNIPRNPTLGYLPKRKENLFSYKNLHENVYRHFSPNQNQPRYHLIGEWIN